MRLRRLSKVGHPHQHAGDALIGAQDSILLGSGGSDAVFSADPAGKHLRRTRLSRGGPSFVEDQAVDIVDEVGERDLRFGACDADGADKQPHLILLTGEHVLNAGANGRALGIRTGRAPGHRFASGLLAMDPADPVHRLQPRLVGMAAVGGVRPDVVVGVAACNKVAQRSTVEACTVGDLG